MKTLCAVVLASGVLAFGNPIGSEAPTAAELVERAIDVAERGEEGGKAYSSVLDRELRKFDSRGELRERRQLRYEIRSEGGEQEFRLVEFDGRAPRAKEERAEQRRRESLDEDAGGFLLNRELTERYELELAGYDEVGGRRAFVTTFRPKGGRLPEKSKVDCVLNRSAGRIWIDVEDGALVKIEYRLLEPARYWLGLLGSVKGMMGVVEYTRVEPGVWLPARVDVDLEGRVLLSSLNQSIRLRWSNYTKAG